MGKEKPRQFETNQKQSNDKGRFGKGEYRPNSSGFNYSGGAESQFKPKSGCFICGGIGHKAFSCPQRSRQQNQHKNGRNDQQHRVAACQVVEERVDEDEWSDRKVNLPGIGSVYDCSNVK